MGQQIVNSTAFGGSIVHRRGAALLVVLFIVMAITVLSLGFLSRSDIELACGRNMVLRTQMDYLAESGLEHARGLILNPQDVDTEYWTGADAQQLVAGSMEYYDLEVERDDSDPTDRCNYTIDCNSYWLEEGERIGLSEIQAQLRLDPCIALWVGSDTTLWSDVTIKGDVYCHGVLTNHTPDDAIDGDVFANELNGNEEITGQEKLIADLSLDWPRVTVADFTSNYTTQTVSTSTLSGQTFGPYNPVRICYRDGNLVLAGNVQITGMLVVNGDLTVQGRGNTLTAAKKCPALLVTGNLIVDGGGHLNVSGLAVVDGGVQISGDAGHIRVEGGLFTGNYFSQTASDSSIYNSKVLLHNGPLWQPEAGIGGALRFDGTNDYAQTLDNNTTLQLDNDYTLSVRINPYASQKVWAGIVSKTDSTGTTNHWTLQFDSSNPRRLIIYHPSGSWNTGINLGHVAGDWHHIVVVRSGNTMTSYLDGIARNSGTFDHSPGSGHGHLNIGCDRTASPSYVYRGLIDDVFIYNRGLEDVNDVGVPDGLIGYWRFNESGSNVDIVASPTKTAIEVWSQSGDAQKWGQAAGAFFKRIERRKD